MQGQILIIGSVVVVTILIVIIILHFVRKMRLKSYQDKVEDLEVMRNLVASAPIPIELSKVEPIIKNDKMEEKYNQWQERL